MPQGLLAEDPAGTEEKNDTSNNLSQIDRKLSFAALLDGPY
ncbi:MAG: hypothetical protein ACTHJ0_04040 [Flavipsychrobacter sp.]